MTAARGKQRWRSFRESRFLPATVIAGIIACAAALFVGSYTYATANPKPRHIPVAVVGDVPAAQAQRLESELNAAMDSSLEVRHTGDRARALDLLAEQTVFAVIETAPDQTMTLGLSSASGQTVATVLQNAVPPVAQRAGYTVTTTDLHPLQPGDPHGLTLFYMTIASVVVGFVGAIQLGVHARGLRPGERIAFIAAYAVLGGFAILVTVDRLLGALDLPLLSWPVLTLTMFTSGMVFTMFSALFGRWAMLPTWGIMILLGNPTSGGSVSWPLLPGLLAAVGRWLPPAASVDAQHTAVYFPDHQHLGPWLVLSGWSAAGIAVFLIAQRRADS
ncbi:ABC transporter permease [Nocardia carnea]|uniref:ABC transporter permease n=1 Tax=Nocardia carnea TaxID=37328 RepID=UPI002457FDF5|nr:ABC transporter permease [Nocardia carnea]